MKKRLNIGFLITDIDEPLTKQACKGAELGAMTIDANLYIFPMKYLDSRDFLEEHSRFEYQYNMIYRFATEKNLDILFVMMGLIGCRTVFDEQIAFLNKLPKMPIVTLFTRLAGYPSVIFDNKGGFERNIAHIIEKHGAKNIGFVSGPMTNVDAVERLDVYKEVLSSHGIDYDEDKVVYGDFESNSGAIVDDLLTRHPELDSIVFANDMMVLGGYPVIERHGYDIGKNMLVVGFDNSPFASTLVPALTTVEANAAELAYRAVLDTKDFLETGELKNTEVDTHVVRRSSCGCDSFDYGNMAERLGLSSIDTKDDINTERIHDYLFGEYVGSAALQRIEKELDEFIGLLYDMVAENRFESEKKRIQSEFTDIVSQPVLLYTTTERFFNVLIALQNEFAKLLVNDRSRLSLMDVFSTIYRTLAIFSTQMVEGQHENIERLNHMINNMTRDIFLLDDADSAIPYETALSALPGIGIRSAYMYTFEETRRYFRGEKWNHPKKLYLRAYCNEKGSFGIPREDSEVRVNKLFNNEYMPKDRRVSMILTPLFSGEEIYGILISEVEYENYESITPVGIQLSSALKSLLLLEKQRDVQKTLENNLDILQENNDALNMMSKTDELTGLYNRRGFLEHAHEAIVSEKNRGKKALVVYADMDNLKMINDKFSHDDGDFAIRETGLILKDTFRTTDIISRFGGDEFVVFAIVGQGEYEQKIKDRIAEVTVLHNQAAGKPYPIEMSTGVYEFECGPDIDIYDVLDIADEKLHTEKAEKKAKNGSYR